MKKVQLNTGKKSASAKAKDRDHDDGNDGLCVVCFRHVGIYSVGDCDHPVCFECSTRMRVLIGKNECPICRQEMSQVVFITKKNLAPFRTLNTRNMSYERRYCIYFETDKEMQSYDMLLNHSCPVCPANATRPFSNFQMLKDHVIKQHQYFYCELCLEHLKIFSRERRAYSRQELAQHRRKGDPDNTSHRGHPLCEFCDTRYMDHDELYRHLRKDHFYCHFCDTDGVHQYYDDYNALRKHFGAAHFLCEEGDCRNEQFTSVFRNKLDMQAHFLETHAGTKQAIRQARTVDIEFTLNHAPQLVDRGGQGRGRGGRGRGGRGGRMGRGGDDGPTESPPTPPPPQHSIDINCVQDFPTLGGLGVADSSAGRGGGSGGASQNRSFTLRAMRGNVASMQEEFPSLISPATTSVNVVTTTGPPSNHYSASASSQHPTTSVHLKVNSKKGIVGGVANGGTGGGGGGTRSAVSIQYNRMGGGDRGMMSASNGSLGGKHSGNITLKSKSNNAGSGNKENADFPSLGQPSKSLGDTFRSLNDFTSGSGPLYSSKSTPLSSNSSTRATSAKSNGKASGSAKSFNKNDFPTLAADPQQDQYMKNYHGMSKVTVPVSNSWTKTTDYVPKPQAPVKTPSVVLDNSSSSKAKKKKGNNSQQSAASSNFGATASASQDSGGHSTNKKRPLRLGNVFDDSDDEETKVSGYTFAGPRRRGDVLFSDYNAVSAPPPTSSVRVVSSAEVEATRKKSELKIGSLKHSSAPAFNSLGDFPSLVGMSSSSSTSNSNNSKKNNGNNSTGGGSGGDSWTSISSNNNSNSKKAQKNGVKSNNFSNTDMTFHSSYGESFSISPSEETPNGSFTPAVRSSSRASNASLSKGSSGSQKQPKKDTLSKKQYEFIHPPDFEERNQQLIKTISELCGGNTDKFNQFKKLAGNFRHGSLSGREYYQQCRQLMGRATLLKLLPELLVLLPDISKQQAVFTSFKQMDDHHNNNNNSSKAGSDALQFDECDTCGQVLSPRDHHHHIAKHNLNDADFPSLKSVSACLS